MVTVTRTPRPRPAPGTLWHTRAESSVACRRRPGVDLNSEPGNSSSEPESTSELSQRARAAGLRAQASQAQDLVILITDAKKLGRLILIF